MTLKEYFKEKRGRQSELAAQLDTSHGYLGQIANGQRFPSRDMALAISKATGGTVKAATLLGLEAA